MILKIEKAYGLIKLTDGTRIELDGRSFDLDEIKDPNMICSIGEDEIGDDANLLLITDTAEISFTDAQNVRLFIGHNKMLKHKAKMDADRENRIQKIAEYMFEHPEKDHDTIYLSFQTARAADIRAARRIADKRTDPEEIKVWCEFGAHDTITFDETWVTDDFDDMRLRFLEAIAEHCDEQEIDYYEINDDLVDYNEVQVTVSDDSGDIIGNGWIKEV